MRNTPISPIPRWQICLISSICHSSDSISERSQGMAIRYIGGSRLQGEWCLWRWIGWPLDWFRRWRWSTDGPERGELTRAGTGQRDAVVDRQGGVLLWWNPWGWGFHHWSSKRCIDIDECINYLYDHEHNSIQWINQLMTINTPPPTQGLPLHPHSERDWNCSLGKIWGMWGCCFVEWVWMADLSIVYQSDPTRRDGIYR